MDKQEYQRNYRKINREKIKEYQRNYQQENKIKIKQFPSRLSPEYKKKLKSYRENLKMEVFRHYANDNNPKCVKCGFNDIRALCLDHVNGDGNHRSKKCSSGYTFYCYLKKNKYPEQLQVLCANCNLIKQHVNKEFRYTKKK